ncbi:MAG TPA: DinB family protein [Pyrinomonadaceae bacterium]|nr:DinB family protein [Pyrinomonadaceae bacterium]
MSHPLPNEAAAYYSRYIDLIPEDEILAVLKAQLRDTAVFLSGISDEQSLHRYEPDKWTIREVMNHVNDGERIFLSRALWFARGFKEALPGFDQDVGVAGSAANEMSWSGLKEEFANVRKSTISFFENLTAEAWLRTGIASDNKFTVNALAYIIAGHVAHHRKVIAERYL